MRSALDGTRLLCVRCNSKQFALDGCIRVRNDAFPPEIEGTMARAGKPTGRSAGGERAQARTRRLPTAEAMVGNEPPSRARPRSSVPADAIAIPQPRNDWIVVGNRRFPGNPRAIGHRTLDVLPDMPDIRDRLYQPHLRALLPGIFPRVAFPVRDQGELPSCTGHALAHLIDALRFREIGPDRPLQVSARMLYEMAKRNDEWAGSTYEGSSARGAIKGLFRNGVCPRGPDKEETSPEWVLTYERAKAAREVRLGAYYRLEPDISDYHAALNEIGAIYVSAQIHSHWDEPEDGRIKPGGEPRGGHAFVILGYDDSRVLGAQFLGARLGARRARPLAVQGLGELRHGCVGAAARGPRA